jgi:membrane protein
MSDEGASARLKNAPSPDDPRKPDGPTDMSKRSWFYVLRKTLREFTSDQCTDIAASLVYFSVLAIFPAMLALVSLLGVVGQGEKSISTIFSTLKSAGVGSSLNVIRAPLEQFASSPAAGLGLITGIVLAVWSASGYIGAFSRGMNRIYNIDEGRPVWKMRPMQLIVTIIIILLVLVMVLALIISGPITTAIGNAIGLGSTVQFVWSIIKWPILAIAVILMIAVLFYATPNVKQPKFRWVSLGSVVALVVLLIASAAFAFYIANFSNYNKTYGSFAGVIIFFLWLWIANNALLFGAEFDAEIERGRELQAGIAAEENIQLPPRDARKSEKAEKKRQKDIDMGRDIRESAARSSSDSDGDAKETSGGSSNRRGGSSR